MVYFSSWLRMSIKFKLILSQQQNKQLSENKKHLCFPAGCIGLMGQDMDQMVILSHANFTT